MEISDFSFEKAPSPTAPLNHTLAFAVRADTDEYITASIGNKIREWAEQQYAEKGIAKPSNTEPLTLTLADSKGRSYKLDFALGDKNGMVMLEFTQREDLGSNHPQLQKRPALLALPEMLRDQGWIDEAVAQYLKMILTERYPAITSARGKSVGA